MLIAGTSGASAKSLSESLNVRRATLSARINGHAPFSQQLLADVAGELGDTASEIVRRAESTISNEVAS